MGLEDDPIGALERTRRPRSRSIARRHGVADAVQGSFGISDGETLWAVRYATDGTPRSLFASTDVETVRRLHPDNPRFQQMTRTTTGSSSPSRSPTCRASGRRSRRATAVTVRARGALEERPFAPIAPQRAASPSRATRRPGGWLRRRGR